MLPNGAHAIVMDYYVNVVAHRYTIGESGSMDDALLNHIIHVRKQDYESDYPRATDAREHSSIIN
ncbi:hypothetical protein I4U23_005326 [Adineta vaga]|nr:hypothetical protein I4U23_005326 [Adineta vaga]